MERGELAERNDGWNGARNTVGRMTDSRRKPDMRRFRSIFMTAFRAAKMRIFGCLLD